MLCKYSLFVVRAMRYAQMHSRESQIILLRRVVQAGNYRCFLDGYLQQGLR
jgi:hypothetical protein